MHKDLMAPPPRQQKLAFAVDEVWLRLPNDVREKCAERVTRLLQAAIETERQARRESDERQDWS
jgi:hypothetical protein